MMIMRLDYAMLKIELAEIHSELTTLNEEANVLMKQIQGVEL